jgi:predicted metal-dependent hydrolase
MQVRQVQDIQYQLLAGADRKTTDIVIERNGVVRVRPPLKMTPEQVDETVFSKRSWIYRNLAQWRDLNATCVVREWVNGETFLYLGSSYRLSLVDEQDEPLKLKDGRFQLLKTVLLQGGHVAAQLAFENFYKSKGLTRIVKRVEHFASRIGVMAGDVMIKDLGYRWATCLTGGDMHFHWKCLMAPLTVIDYVVVHELCHLRYRDHSNSFWNEVDKVMPQYRERKEWLRRRGAELNL